MKNHAGRILNYLQSIYPEGATNSEISRTLDIQPHQTVFHITRMLVAEGKIRGVQGLVGEREWTFFALGAPEGQSAEDVQPHPVPPAKKANPAAEFEQIAAQALSRHYGTPLRKGTLPGVPKLFDLVSEDGSVVGDAKYFTLVGGKRLPPAKFSVIAEYVWLLENVEARDRFLVFGNQREVPADWLRKYGHLVKKVTFYYLSADGQLEQLN